MPRVTIIGPDQNAPEVPRNPRFDSTAVQDGLLDLAKGAANYLEAREKHEAHVRDIYDQVLQQDGDDFDAKRSLFDRRAQEGRAKLFQGVTDPATRERLEEDADATDTRYGKKVQRETFTRFKENAKTRVKNGVKTAAGDAARAATPAEKDAIRRSNNRAIVEAERGGLIAPEEGENLAYEFERDAAQATVSELAATDPDAALQMLDGGEMDFIPEAERNLMRDKITAMRDMDVAARAADTEQAVKAVTQSLQTGVMPSDEAMDLLQGVASEEPDSPLAQAVGGLRSAQNIVRKMGRLSLPAATALLQKEAAASEGVAREALVTFGAGWLKNMQQSLATDPLRFAVEQDLLDLEPLDWQQAAPEQFAARAKQARMVAQYYGMPAPKYMTGEERAQLSEAFGKAEPQQKAALLKMVADSFGKDDGIRLFREIDGLAETDAHLATLAVHGGGREDIARRGFVGRKLIADKAVTLPDDSAFASVEDEVIGALYDARHAKSRSNVIAASRALYAERHVSKGLAGLDADEYRASLEAAMGKGTAGGGPANRNGRKLVLPMDMTQADLDDHMRGLTDDDLVKISVSGKKPVHLTLSGKVMPATPEDLKKAVLVQSGYGRYRVSMTDPAKEAGQYLADEATGEFYEIDLSDAAKRPGKMKRVAVGAGGKSGGVMKDVMEPAVGDAPVVKDQERVPEGEMPVKKKKLITDRVPVEEDPRG